MTRIADEVRIYRVEGKLLAVLERRPDGAIVAVRIASKRDAAMLLFVIGNPNGYITSAYLPDGLNPGPFFRQAFAAPVTIDDVFPTDPSFLDWWRRVTLGEIRRGELVGEGLAGDPLEHQADEEQPRPRRRVGAHRTGWERDVDGEYVVLEVGAEP